MERVMKTIFLVLALAASLTVACGGDDDPVAPTGTNQTALLTWTFDDDFDGWDSGTNSAGVWGTAQWSDHHDGCIKLDGVGFEGEPNAWIHREIELPADAKTLSYESSAHDRGDGAVSLRVRLIDDNTDEHTLLDWEELETGDEGHEFFPRSLDISSFAGQTVTVYLEIGDIDGGGNNQRYLDTIAVKK
jgi:hypothetical protein